MKNFKEFAYTSSDKMGTGDLATKVDPIVKPKKGKKKNEAMSKDELKKLARKKGSVDSAATSRG